MKSIKRKTMVTEEKKKVQGTKWNPEKGVERT